MKHRYYEIHVNQIIDMIKPTSRAASILISVCSLTCSCSPISCDVCLDEFNVFTSSSSSSKDPCAVCNNLPILKVSNTSQFSKYNNYAENVKALRMLIIHEPKNKRYQYLINVSKPEKPPTGLFFLLRGNTLQIVPQF